MYWSDRVAKDIIESGKFTPYKVDDMFTPSGYAHIGSLRGPLIHDLIHKSLQHAGEEAVFTYVINDFDPIDGLPEELTEEFSKYLGVPLRNVPSPKEGFSSFADFFGSDYKNVLKNLGVEPQILSSWDMYHDGKFNEVIKEALDNANKIQDIYQRVSGSKKKESGWLPLQVICQNCGKLGTTRVYEWDGETVAYKCEPNMVTWAKGCDFSGRISPFNGNGKLPWKVDWPAHWKVLNITIEGAGKDHSVAGSSRDVAKELCKDVFQIDEPFNLPYEFIIIGGKKMSSSKGLGLKARDLAKLLPYEVGRFLFCRSDYKQAVEFDPNGTNAIPDLFDEYDRCHEAYITGSDEDLARTFETSQIGKLPSKEKILLPRFRDVANYLQQSGIDIIKKYEEIKGSNLNEDEMWVLNERIKYAKIWLEEYAPEELRLQLTATFPVEAKNLDDDQKRFLEEMLPILDKDLAAEDLQLELYNLTKTLDIKASKAFSAIYLSLIGKQYGPKAAWFLLQYPKEDIVNRLKEAIGK